MNWKHKTIIRILFLIASIVAGEDAWLTEELRKLGNHISAGIGENR